MSTITTGLATASLAALALGAVTPAAATAAPSSPASTASTASTSSTDAGSSPTITAAGVEAPIVRRVEARGSTQFSVSGVALGAQAVFISIPGSSGGDLAPVVQGRFTTILDNEHLGKTVTLSAIGPNGRGEAVEVVLELGVDESETTPPATPVVHAVSSYDDEHLVIEGTVVSDPRLFSQTDVVAPRLGLVYDAPDANGSFSLRVPVEHRGETIDVQAFRAGMASEVVRVVLEETDANTASEVFPLELGSPTPGEVVKAPQTTFSGSAIPNSQIVVTHDTETERSSATLCETRVASSGDWSCTSPQLPAGDYETSVVETPTWASAPRQETGASFTVAPTEDDGATTPALPLLSSVTRNSAGDLVVRVIANRAARAEIQVGEHLEQVSGLHQRFAFVVDGSLEGQTATVTGIGIGTSARSRSLEIPLTPIEQPAPSPLAAPLAHSVDVNGDGSLSILGTTSYFANEFDVPSVIAQFEGNYIGGTGITWNGAYVLTVDPEYAGKEIDLISVRGLDMSESTTVLMEQTDDNTAPDVFPLDVVSPAEGAEIAADTDVFTGKGIPGSTVTLSTAAEGAGTLATEVGEADVLADGTWQVEVDEALAAGPQTLTVTETPYWDSLAPLTSTRSFTVASEGGEGDPETRVLTIEGDGTVSATGLTTLTGAGHPGATVTLHPFGEGRGGEVRTEVRPDGTWTISRGFGPTTYNAAVFVQTGAPGADQTVAHPLDGTRTSSLIIDGDGTVSPTGRTTITGTGDAGATVTLHPFGVGRGGEVSTQVRPDGTWSISRGFGPTTYNAAVFVQTGGPAADQSVPFPLDGTR